MDMEIDTGKLDIFGTIITQVKMEGRVPASTHLVYDCSHGEWLLAQMAYDRKIRLFSSRYSPTGCKNTAILLYSYSYRLFAARCVVVKSNAIPSLRTMILQIGHASTGAASNRPAEGI